MVEQKPDTTDIAPSSMSSTIIKEEQQQPIQIEKGEKDIASQQPSTATIDVANVKDSEILNEVSSLNTFTNIMAYLNNRKVSNHDIVFKATMQFGNVINAYWLVFDKSKNLIAILTKDKALNLINSTSVNSNDYANSPKVWLQIY